MGEVYCALDTRLNRDVAIKVLPDLMAAHPERLARFEREAQLLASLNHPRIAQIYGFEDSSLGGSSQARVRALVMELVDGPTLGDRIADGPMPLDEVLPIARQIAEALETAHERGIIHRDLKPANIKLTAKGVVKVLDFGLAKALDPISGGAFAAAGANSPAFANAATESGMILGTAPYMAPEQARGKPVDKRADMWAAGVVLFEMLAGCRLFEGETASETIAAVLRQEIDWTRLPPDTPRACGAFCGVASNVIRRTVCRTPVICGWTSRNWKAASALMQLPLGHRDHERRGCSSGSLRLPAWSPARWPRDRSTDPRMSNRRARRSVSPSNRQRK
jgi:serine/threonine-protein kinase